MDRVNQILSMKQFLFGSFRSSLQDELSHPSSLQELIFGGAVATCGLPHVNLVQPAYPIAEITGIADYRTAEATARRLQSDDTSIATMNIELKSLRRVEWGNRGRHAFFSAIFFSPNVVISWIAA
jgi:hypothetical protein